MIGISIGLALKVICVILLGVIEETRAALGTPASCLSATSNDCCLSNGSGGWNIVSMSSVYVSKDTSGLCWEIESPANLLRCFDSYCLSVADSKCIDSTSTTTANFTGRLTDSHCIDSSYVFTSGQATCFKDGYCIDNSASPNLTCHKLESASTSLYVGREASTGYCLQMNTATAEQCGEGEVCLNASLMCVQFEVQLDTPTYIGRSIYDGTCLTIGTFGTTESQACQENYCLNTASFCVELNAELYIGREYLTTNCILKGDSTRIASSCAPQYTLQTINQYYIPTYQTCCDLPLAFGNRRDRGIWCIPTPSSSKGLGGVPDFYQRCIMQVVNPVSDPASFTISSYFSTIESLQAKYCAKHSHCITSGSLCDRVDINGTNKCAGANQVCLTINSSCVTCSYDSCMDPSNTCLTLDQATSQCQTETGFCEDTTNLTCISCPSTMCYTPEREDLKCLPFKKMEIDSNKCIQKKFGHVACSITNMDTREETKNSIDLYCSNNEMKCTLIYQQSPPTPLVELSNCLQCPKSYRTPGNNKCYFSGTVATTSPTGSNPFGLNILKETILYNSLTGVTYDNSLGGNCFIRSGGNCLECIEGQFLLGTTCSSCPVFVTGQLSKEFSKILADTSVFGYYKNSYLKAYEKEFSYKTPSIPANPISFRCMECIQSLDDWKGNTNFFNCKSYSIEYDYLPRYVNATKYYASYESVSLNPVTYTDLTGTVLNCNIILKSDSGVSTCAECTTGYALDLKTNQCVACAPFCSECYFGGIYKNEMVDWANKPPIFADVDINTVPPSSYLILCRGCKLPAYTLKIDFSDCEPCASRCKQCYQGNPSFNLTALQVLYDPSYLVGLGLKRKCTLCEEGYNFKTDHESCQPDIPSCVRSRFIKTSGSLATNGYTTAITEHLWFDSLQAQTFSCLLCKRRSNGQINYNSALKTCDLTSIPAEPNCEVFSDNVCKLCNDKSILIIPLSTQQFCKDTMLCSEEIYGCNRCYMYEEGTTKIFQCVECKGTGKVPGVGGCLDCPTGCGSCYEGSLQTNFTSILLYDYPTMRQGFSIYQRIFSKPNYDTNFICTSCLDGYKFNVETKLCVQNDCGSNCKVCSYTSEEPVCLVPHVENLVSQISSIVAYIGQFYYGMSNFDYSQLISFNSKKTNAHLCPILCNGCEETDTTSDQYNLYATKCFGCKANIKAGFLPIFSGSTVTFDRQRGRCYLCQEELTPPNNAVRGCHYKKQVIIQLECTTILAPIQNGSGVINLQRGTEVNWDKIILNEPDFESAYIMYNELGLREIEVLLQFTTNTCLLDQYVSIESSIKSKIKSLELFKVVVQGFAPTDPTVLTLNAMMDIKGFHHVEIQDLTVRSADQVNVKQYGINIASDYVDYLLFKNLRFERTNWDSRVVPTIESVLYVQVQNLINTFIIDTVYFNGVYMVGMDLIQLIYTDTSLQETASIDISVTDLTLYQVDIRAACFLRMSLIYVNLKMKHITLLEGGIDGQFPFLYQSNANKLARMDADLSDFLSKSFALSSYCSFFLATRLKTFYARSFIIQNTSFMGNIQSFFFQVNGGNFNDFTIYGNTIKLLTLIKGKTFELGYNPFESSTVFTLYSFVYERNIYYGSIYPLILQFEGFSISDGQSIQVRDFIATRGTPYLNYVSSTLFDVSSIESVSFANMVFQDTKNVQAIRISEFKKALFSSITCEGTKTASAAGRCIDIINFYSFVVLKEIKIYNLNYSVAAISILQEIVNPGSSATGITVDGLIIDGNKYTQTQSFLNIAGFYYENYSSLPITFNRISIKNNVFTSNGKKIYGRSSSGIYVASWLGYVGLTDGILDNNQSLVTKNGIAIESDFVDLSAFVFMNSNPGISTALDTNNAQGGFLFVKSRSLIVSESSFMNSKHLQGALYWAGHGVSEITLRSCTFSNNLADFSSNSSKGGAIFIETQNSNSILVDILNNSFIRNTAMYQGGAIYIQDFRKPLTVRIQSCHFEDNWSAKGGSIKLFSGDEGSISIVQSTFSFNPVTVLAIDNLVTIALELDSTDREELGFILLSEINLIKFENNVFSSLFDYSTSTKAIYDANDQTIQSLMYQPWVLVESSNTFSDIASTFFASVTVNPILVMALKTQFSITNTVISKVSSLNSRLVNIASNISKSTALFDISAQRVDIIGLQASKMVCLECETGNFKIASYILNIRSSVFQKNSAGSGGALYLKKLVGNSPLIILNNLRHLVTQLTIATDVGLRKIESTSFSYNTAAKGGAVYLDTVQIDVVDSNFFGNEATKQGGAVFYYLDPEALPSKNQFVVVRSQFIWNKARVGGAIFSISNPISKIEDVSSSNTFTNNIGTEYGTDYITNPVALQVRSSNIGKKDAFVLSSHNNGVIENELLVEMVNSKGEIYTSVDTLQAGSESGEVYLNLTISSSSIGLLSPSSMKFTGNYFNLTDLLSVVSAFDSVIDIEFTSAFLRNPTYDLITGNLTDFPSAYKFSLSVQIRSCVIGEETKSITNSYSTCVACVNPTYNIKPGEKCDKCPISGAFCEGSTLLLPAGYWRQNFNTSEILTCKNKPSNCVGDVDRKGQVNVTRNIQNNYCAEGYIGVRCEDCDISGENWGSSFYRYMPYNCEKCESLIEIAVLFLKIMCVMAFICVLMVRWTMNLVSMKVLQKVLVTGRRQARRWESGLEIKLLLHHIQIIYVLFTLNLSMPQLLYNSFVFVANPIHSASITLDCLMTNLPDQFVKRILYFRIVASQILVVFSIFIFFFFFMMLASIFRWKSRSVFVKIALAYIFIANQPGVINLILGSFRCESIEPNGTFVQDYSQYACDSEHSKMKFVLFLPILLIWGVIIPLLIYRKLKQRSEIPLSLEQSLKNRSEEDENLLASLAQKRKDLADNALAFPKENPKGITLNTASVLETSWSRYGLGFFYLEYRRETFYWEFVKIIEKMIIIFVLNFYAEDIILKGIIIFNTIFFYSLLSLFMRPYLRRELNILDFWSSNVCAITITLGVVATVVDNDSIPQIVCYVGIVLINLFILLWFLKNFLASQLELFENFLNDLKLFLVKMSPGMKDCLKPRIVSQNRTKMIWSLIRTGVLGLAGHIHELRQKKESEEVEQHCISSLADSEGDLIFARGSLLLRRFHDETFVRSSTSYPPYPEQAKQSKHPEQAKLRLNGQLESVKGFDYGNMPKLIVDENNISKNQEDNTFDDSSIDISGISPSSSPLRAASPLKNVSLDISIGKQRNYLNEFKEAYERIQEKKWRALKRKDINYQFDITNNILNPVALRNSIKSQRNSLTTKLNILIDSYSEIPEIQSYFKGLLEDMEMKMKVFKHESEHNQIAAFLLYTQNSIEVQLLIMTFEKSIKELLEEEVAQGIVKESQISVQIIQWMTSNKEEYEIGGISKAELNEWITVTKLQIDVSLQILRLKSEADKTKYRKIISTAQIAVEDGCFDPKQRNTAREQFLKVLNRVQGEVKLLPKKDICPLIEMEVL